MHPATVIIPVWNGRVHLERLLKLLPGQTFPIAEILVVDNGSQDDSAALAQQYGARVLRMGANLGFSRAVNAGIEACQTDLLALLNNDVEPAPDWLEKLVRAVDNPDVWFATGKLRSALSRGLIDGTYDLICRGGTAWRVGSGRPDSAYFSESRTISLAPATAVLYKKELFAKVGVFDASFESYLEDVDFGLRCACRNLSGRYVPEAVAYHWGSATLGKWHPDTVRRISRNQVLLVARHYPPRLLWRYAWSILVAQTLWGFVAARHGGAWAFIAGKLAGLRGFRKHRTGEFAGEARLAQLLDESESEILQIQRQTGFDRYWRLYFLMTKWGGL